MHKYLPSTLKLGKPNIAFTQRNQYPPLIRKGHHSTKKDVTKRISEYLPPQTIEENKTNLIKSTQKCYSISNNTTKLEIKKAIDIQYKEIQTPILKNTQKQKTPKKQNYLYLEYCTKENYKQNQVSFNSSTTNRRLLRIKSHDSLSKKVSNDTIQDQYSSRIKTLKQQNVYYKQTLGQSLKRLKQSQNVLSQQKKRFEHQQRSYEKHINSLRSKIENGRNQIGHLFSYNNFDPATLVIKPIVEVQQNSSIMRCSFCISDSGSKTLEINSQYGSFLKGQKKVSTETTQTTEMPSMQDSRDIA